MCGAIATVCKSENCKNMARYSLYCYKCDKEEDD